MKIEKTNILTNEQKSEIIDLQSISYKTEGLSNEAFLSNEINFDKSIPCFYLGYEDLKLVSFLTTFIPQKNEAEIIAFTHPDHRMKGWFSKLLESALEVLKESDVSSLLFCIEPKSKSGNEVLKKFKLASWKNAEYTLFLEKPKKLDKERDLTLELLNEDNKEICLKLSTEIFGMSEEDNKNFIENAIKSLDRDAYIVYDNNKVIGTFNLNSKDDKAFIYGVGVRPNCQHKGYGKKIMKHILNIAFSKANKAILDVDSDNPSAYNLYIHNGFKIDFQVDYYFYNIM